MLPKAWSLKYCADALDEGVQADPRDELLEHRGALGVGDHVEVDLDRVQVDVVGRDRVRRGQLVGAVAGLLAGVGEAGPGVGVLGRLGLAPVAGPLGERLVEPQVVPPLHGDEVAEPHVRHLVGDHGRAELEERARLAASGGGTRRAASRSRRSPSRPCCTRGRRAGRTCGTGRGSRTSPRRTRSSAWSARRARRCPCARPATGGSSGRAGSCRTCPRRCRGPRGTHRRRRR